MKIISWNVAGLRSIIKKGFYDFITSTNADIYCLQEVKTTENIKLTNYYSYLHSANRLGYSGVLILSKIKPKTVKIGLECKKIDEEGRVLTLEYDKFYLINVYAPHSKPKLERLDYHLLFEDKLRNYIDILKKHKPVIIAGDFNVAYQDIDIHIDKKKRQKAGISREEREQFGKLLDGGFIDTYRYLYPNSIAYTNWCYSKQSRERNIGWRVDYFLVSESLMSKVKDNRILSNVYGSDHCPIELDIE